MRCHKERCLCLLLYFVHQRTSCNAFLRNASTQPKIERTSFKLPPRAKIGLRTRHVRSHQTNALLSPKYTSGCPHFFNRKKQQCRPLHANTGSQDDDPSSTAKRPPRRSDGVYARPSAAIERGSGFFVPGLEGPGVRGLFGVIVLVLLLVNHGYGGGSVTDGVVVEMSSNEQQRLLVSEVVGAAAGLLLLFQSVIEYFKDVSSMADQGLAEDVNEDAGTASNTAANKKGTLPINSSSNLFFLPDDTQSKEQNALLRDELRWTAASYISLTPATNVLLVASSPSLTPRVMFRLGSSISTNAEATDENSVTECDAVQAAIRTVFDQSKGGRVAVPGETHPAAQLLPLETRRSVLLQRVGDTGRGGEDLRCCLVVGSNQLLQRYTKGDLAWLGCFAEYVGRAVVGLKEGADPKETVVTL